MIPHPPLPAWLAIRRLRDAERGALAAHLLALPPEDRQARFGAWFSDAAVRAHCAGLALGADALGCGAFAGPRLIGAALAMQGPGGFAEIAVSVDAAWRRRRVAAMLVCEACALAVREQGASRALFLFSPANLPVIGLVRHLGGIPRRAEGLAEIALGAAA
jgi:GNAT superfamily N-acetyltransferase